MTRLLSSRSRAGRHAWILAALALTACDRPIETVDDLPDIPLVHTVEDWTYAARRLSAPTLDFYPVGQLGEAVETTYGVPVVAARLNQVYPEGRSASSLWVLAPGEFVQTTSPFSNIRSVPGTQTSYIDHQDVPVSADEIDGRTFIGPLASRERREALQAAGAPLVDTLADGRHVLVPEFGVFTDTCGSDGRCTFVPGGQVPTRWTFNNDGYLEVLPTFQAIRAQSDSVFARHGFVRDEGSARWTFEPLDNPLPIAVYLRDDSSSDGRTLTRTVIATAYFHERYRPNILQRNRPANYLVVFARGMVPAAEAARRPAFRGQVAARASARTERTSETPSEAFERARNSVLEANRSR